MRSSSSRALSDVLTIVWKLRILILPRRPRNLPLWFDVILYSKNFLTSNNENLRPFAGEAAERTFEIYSVPILVFSVWQTTQWKSAEIVNLLGFFSQYWERAGTFCFEFLKRLSEKWLVLESSVLFSQGYLLKQSHCYLLAAVINFEPTYIIQAGPSMMWFFYTCCRCSMRSISKFSAWLA